MNKIKAVIFDMDGLIVDSEILESQSLIKVLLLYEKKPQLHDTGLVHVVGNAENTYVELIKKHGIKEELNIFRNKKREIFTNLLEQKLTPFEGFYDLVALLKKNKIKIALASNRYEKHIHIILENLGIKKSFDVIVGPSEKRRHKPHPDIYLFAAKELGVEPKDCIVLEDSNTGVLSAKRAGMKVIAVPNQHTIAHDLSKADIIIKSLTEVNMQLLNSL